MAFERKPRVLITRVRPDSVSGEIAKRIMDSGLFDLDSLPLGWDITDLDTYSCVNFGDYDFIFNCTGITLNQSVLENYVPEVKKVFNVNVIGAMSLTTEYAIARKNLGLGGAIVHIGSMGSKMVFTNCSAYCASKAALAHYIKCAGYELRKDGIAVIGVHPGNIRGTAMTNNVQSSLLSVRGMNPEQIMDIYKDAHSAEDVALFATQMMAMPLLDITGENFYMGRGHKG